MGRSDELACGLCGVQAHDVGSEERQVPIVRRRKEMIYEFGVMSKRWTVESDDEEVAKIAMSLFIGQDVPVTIYKPKESGFLPSTVLKPDDRTIDIVRLRKAMQSVKELQ